MLEYDGSEFLHFFSEYISRYLHIYPSIPCNDEASDQLQEER
jgi:hypothetical protein